MTKPHPDDLAAVLATVLPRLRETLTLLAPIVAASMPDIPQPRKDKL